VIRFSRIAVEGQPYLFLLVLIADKRPQLAGEAERLRGGAALRHAEGAEAQTRGGEGRAGVVEGLADTAEGRGGGFLKHLHLVEDPKRDFGRSH
jgi:hypothetical protein